MSMRWTPQLSGLAVLIAACGSPRVAQPGTQVTVPPAFGTGPAPEPSSARTSRARETVLVDDGGVGDVRIGAAIPPAYLAGEAKRRYTLRWVADAQPFEAFRVGDPPLLAQFNGPFTRWAADHAGELEPNRFVDQAVQEARGGAPVDAIVVEDPVPATSAGVGVGSSFADLSSAYPKAKLSRLPEWFEPKPTCSVAVPELPHIAFHLAACAGNERGDVIRIVVSR